MGSRPALCCAPQRRAQPPSLRALLHPQLPRGLLVRLVPTPPAVPAGAWGHNAHGAGAGACTHHKAAHAFAHAHTQAHTRALMHVGMHACRHLAHGHGAGERAWTQDRSCACKEHVCIYACIQNLICMHIRPYTRKPAHAYHLVQALSAKSKAPSSRHQCKAHACPCTNMPQVHPQDIHNTRLPHHSARMCVPTQEDLELLPQRLRKQSNLRPSRPSSAAAHSRDPFTTSVTESGTFTSGGCTCAGLLKELL